MPLERGRRETLASHLLEDIFLGHTAQLAAAAWKGYVALGRGAVVIFPDAALGYVPIADFDHFSGASDAAFEELLHMYRPAWDVVVVIPMMDESCVVMLKDCDPSPITTGVVHLVSAA
jgi:hypothetical protein